MFKRTEAIVSRVFEKVTGFAFCHFSEERLNGINSKLLMGKQVEVVTGGALLKRCS